MQKLLNLGRFRLAAFYLKFMPLNGLFLIPKKKKKKERKKEIKKKNRWQPQVKLSQRPMKP